MAPLIDLPQEVASREGPRRRSSRQRITRNIESNKSLRHLLLESKVGSARREDNDDGGGDDHHGKEHWHGEEEDNDDASGNDDDRNQNSVPLPSSVTPSPTSLPRTTLEATTTSNPSLSPRSTVDVVIAGSPEILVSMLPAATTSYTPLVTTHTVDIVSTVSASSQPRQASYNPDQLASVASVPTTCVESDAQTTLFAFEDSPTPVVSFNDVDNNYGDDMKHGNDHPPGSLSPGAENALISVGSIGGFIIVCFIFWMAWRMVKKSQRKADDIYGTKFSPPNPLLSNYLGRNQREWQELDNAPNRAFEAPPRYEKTTSMGQASEDYSTNDPRSQAQSIANQGPMLLPQLQTSFSPNNSTSPYSTPTSVDMQKPQTVSPLSQTSQPPAALPQPEPQPNVAPENNTNPFTNTITSSGTAASTYIAIHPSSTVQYGGAMGTTQTATRTEPDRSPMAGPSANNQSEVARQPNGAYDPYRRHVYRASELSSLSSGFGDGDIIIPPPAALNGVPGFSYQQVPSASRKDSLAAASEAGSSSNRDTVYTATSEDMPMRYRTVYSWVNQQTGRVHRAAQRSDEDVPPVPMMPPEERYTMMMDDEEPRRPDTMPVPMPTLPEGAADTPSRYAENKEMNP
ncbi:hypothetical protein VM1G_00163 [Cytospora mali]|uniref:Uncharacterized protein n=1 Tax=Cytospora mali TaxID=578113 RepID=A0A194VLH7_CYTMA|nr:hypothetical protein VM1G_00163 [Valsa mali]